MTPRLITCLLLVTALAAGCGRDDPPPGAEQPDIGIKGTEEEAARGLGFPEFATKNTTRVGGGDAIADAAAVARAVFPGAARSQRPRAIALADSRDWRTALAASVLMAPPIRAPVLLTEGEELPPATAAALSDLDPAGSEAAGGAQVVRVGAVAEPEGYKTTDLTGRDAFELARALDGFVAAARRTTSDRVLVVSADDPAFAMPAAAWAAKSGDPILFARRDSLPEATRAAISAHQQPRIYVLGPSQVLGPKVTRALRRLGSVTRVGGPDPVANAIAFARFLDGPFGWGVVDPGHGLVFASTARPLDAVAAAPLSASGKYGPLLLLDDPDRIPGALADYLLDIQPGYSRDPVRGVYNHGWVVGDGDAISVAVQSRLDAALEIRPISARRRSSP